MNIMNNVNIKKNYEKIKILKNELNHSMLNRFFFIYIYLIFY